MKESNFATTNLSRPTLTWRTTWPMLIFIRIQPELPPRSDIGTKRASLNVPCAKRFSPRGVPCTCMPKGTMRAERDSFLHPWRIRKNENRTIKMSLKKEKANSNANTAKKASGGCLFSRSTSNTTSSGVRPDFRCTSSAMKPVATSAQFVERASQGVTNSPTTCEGTRM
uniref:(northern house mosquito) hypothetical protein n=1 Tax=Culex pipiens TaxID=7175 RepID=A0A8D8LGT9_CULPI